MNVPVNPRTSSGASQGGPTTQGIPASGPTGESLANTIVGRTLLGMLRLAADREFRRADVSGWLTSCVIRPPSEPASGFNPSRWDSIARKSGITGGREQWGLRLSHFAEKQNTEADRRLAAEEISEARADSMKDDAKVANDVQAFVERLAEDLVPPPDGSQWKEFCGWVERLLGDYLPEDVPRSEFAGFEQIRRKIDGLRAADSIGPATTMAEFHQAVEECLRSPVGHNWDGGRGVFVAPISSAVGMSFDAVWLVGMIEGQAPPAFRSDPLIPEAAWQAAGGKSRLAQSIAEERYAYLSVVASVPRCALSYPVGGASSQRAAHPSRWFLEQASVLEGYVVNSGDLPKLRGRPWLSVSESEEQAMQSVDSALLADRHDYDLNRLLQWRRDGRKVEGHPLAQQGTLARAVQLSHSRNLPFLTEYDGNLAAVAAKSEEFERRLKENPVAATSLEGWAACPFRYFLGNVLRLSQQDTPEEITTISPLERGLLVHEILEEFIRDAMANKALPLPGDGSDAASRASVDRIAEKHFLDASDRGITGKPLMWQLAKQEIYDDLETFLQQDARLRAAHGTEPLRVEANFGVGNTPAAVHPESGLQFRGRIDRMDLTSDGKSALVMDYKTGSSAPYKSLDKDIIDRGKRLQLGVYSLAARRLFPEASSIRAAYWFTRTGSDLPFAPSEFFDIDDSEASERFSEGVKTIVEGISRGVFAANPGPNSYRGERTAPENCHYCDFDSLCPARRIDLWQRKKSDNLLSGYVALSEGSTES